MAMASKACMPVPHTFEQDHPRDSIHPTGSTLVEFLSMELNLPNHTYKDSSPITI